MKLSDIYSVTLDDLLREDRAVVRKLAKKERRYKKLLWAVGILSGIVLFGLACCFSLFNFFSPAASLANQIQ